MAEKKEEKNIDTLTLLQAFRGVIYDDDFIGKLNPKVRVRINTYRNRYEKQGKLGVNAMESIAQIRYNKHQESKWKAKTKKVKDESETE